MLTGAVAGALLVLNVDLFVPLALVAVLAAVTLVVIARMEGKSAVS